MSCIVLLLFVQLTVSAQNAVLVDTDGSINTFEISDLAPYQAEIQNLTSHFPTVKRLFFQVLNQLSNVSSVSFDNDAKTLLIAFNEDLGENQVLQILNQKIQDLKTQLMVLRDQGMTNQEVDNYIKSDLISF